MKSYPLSHAQQEILQSCMTVPESTCYNLPSDIVFPKDIDVERLERAVKAIIKVRKELHIKFVQQVDGEIRQELWLDEAIEVEMNRLCSIRPILPNLQPQPSPPDSTQYPFDDFTKPFNLFNYEPLYRFAIVETKENVHLLTDIHHSIADGVTLGNLLLAHDLPLAYADCDAFVHLFDNESPVPPLFMQALQEEKDMNTEHFQDVAKAQRERFQGRKCAKLSADKSDMLGENIIVSLKTERERIDKWCEENDITPNNLFLSAFSLVLSRLCRQQETVLFTLTHGRSDRKNRNAYGMFVKSLPLLINADGRQKARTFLAEVRREQRQAIRNSIYPTTLFCKDLRISPTAVFGFQSQTIAEETEIGGFHITARQLPHGKSNQDLSCMVYVSPENYELRMESSSSLNDERMLQLVAKATLTCVEELMNKQEESLANIRLVTDDEAKELLRLGEGPQMELKDDEDFITMFIRQARKTPDNKAVTDSLETLDYAKLEHLAAWFAEQLESFGMKKGDRVCVEADRRCNSVAALIGIMAAGGVYVPIDLSNPSKRIEMIKADCGADITIRFHDDGVTFVSKNQFPEGRKYMLSDIEKSSSLLHPPSSIHHQPSSFPPPPSSIMYTSGSTGEPKGVVVTHRGLANLMKFIASEWRLNADSRISCHSSLAFDASLEDLLPALTVGGRVYLPDESTRKDLALLHKYLTDNHITGGCYTTNIGVMLAENFTIDTDYLCVGGETLMQNPSNRPRLLNTYGPTEYTVDATYYEVEPGKHYDRIPIGRPLPNTRILLLDKEGWPVPRGAVGELCIQGAQLASGYWNRPEETALRFVEDRLTGQRTYRTGDLARWNSEGNLEFFGREDGQFKRNGYRIEPSEIEAAMLKNESVRQAAVVLSDRLCAFFTATRQLNEVALRKHLRQYLPHYMMPNVFIQLDEMPLSPSGKIDKAALPVPSCTQRPYVEPRDLNEKLLCRLFSKVLEVEKVGIDDNFFELGGTSILVMMLCNEASRYDYPFSYPDVYKWPTVRELVEKDFEVRGARCEVRDHYDTFGNITHKVENATSEKEYSHTSHSTSRNSILITGSTGFLGCHVLWNYLQKTNKTVYCMVRKKGEKSGEERLRERLYYYFGQGSGERRVERGERIVVKSGERKEEIDRLFNERVVVIEGDITNEDDFDAFQNKGIGKVIHCAADVRYFGSGGEIMETNTTGTSNVAYFCLKSIANLIHISTVKTRNTTEYTLSKTLAERPAKDLSEEYGVPSTIIRIGNLMPRKSDGRFQPNRKDNFFMAALSYLSSTGTYPAGASDLYFDISPVDEVAEAIFIIAENESFHNKFGSHESTLWQALPAEQVSLRQIIKAFRRKGHILREANIIPIQPLFDKDTAEKARTLQRKTNQKLAEMGFSWSKKDNDYLEKIINVVTD